MLGPCCWDLCKPHRARNQLLGMHEFSEVLAQHAEHVNTRVFNTHLSFQTCPQPCPAHIHTWEPSSQQLRLLLGQHTRQKLTCLLKHSRGKLPKRSPSDTAHARCCDAAGMADSSSRLFATDPEGVDLADAILTRHDRPAGMRQVVCTRGWFVFQGQCELWTQPGA